VRAAPFGTLGFNRLAGIRPSYHFQVALSAAADQLPPINPQPGRI